jgi:hypothetical protein
LARSLKDSDLLRAVYEAATEIARRSVRHSADFLAATPRAVEALYAAGGGEGDGPNAARAGVALAHAFAVRAGGIAADAWAAVPSAVEGLPGDVVLELFGVVESFLERGGAAALHVLSAGGAVLRAVPASFGAWADLAREVAAQSNASLVALARATPPFFREMRAQSSPARAPELASRVVLAAHGVARSDAEAAICCFRSGPRALRTNTIEAFERWAADGLTHAADNVRARRSYYALETRGSSQRLSGGDDAATGLTLEEVSQTLKFYVEGLTGRAVEVEPLSAFTPEARIGDGRTIHLPSSVSEFGDAALDFKLYKVLAAHAAGQIEFGTRVRDAADLRAAYATIAELYAPENQDALDAFSLDGYINDPSKGERALAPEEEARRERARRPALPEGADYRAALALFPQEGLAARVFGTLENGRIDRRLERAYRGLTRDLELVRGRLREGRPRIAGLPVHLVPFELLFQITLCGGALDDARDLYGQIVSELESIVSEHLSGAEAGVGDTLLATSRVYALFQTVVPEMTERARQEHEGGEGQSSGAQDRLEQERGEGEEEQGRAPDEQERRDARELFNAWASSENAETQAKTTTAGRSVGTPSRPSSRNSRRARRPTATTSGTESCRTRGRIGAGRREKCHARRPQFRRADALALPRRHLLDPHQFQLMKPESLLRVHNELDGDDYDLNAVVDHVLDRRAGGRRSERLYTKRVRRERDVAVAFLLDQSSSTAAPSAATRCSPTRIPVAASSRSRRKDSS